METQESVNAFAGKAQDENTNEGLQSEISIVNNEILDEEYELAAVDELEQEDEDSNPYSTWSKKELLNELRSLVNSGQVDAIRRNVDAIKNSFHTIYRLEQEALDQARLSEDYEEQEYVPDPVEQEFRALMNRFKAAKIELIRDNESAKEENYKLKLALIEELKELVNEEESLNHTFKKFRNIQDRWREIGAVPQLYAKDLWETWHLYVEMFYDYVKIDRELRDLDLKKNLAAKEEIIAKAENLFASDSIGEAFLELQSMHNMWREIGPVARDHKESVWNRFKHISSKIRKKHHKYLNQRRAEQQNNLRMKEKICEQAEAISKELYSAPQSWQKATDKLSALMDEWKSIGFIPKKENTEIFARFGKARNEFFQNKRNYYREIKLAGSSNLKIKERLCEQAEAVMNSDDWKATGEIMRDLQKQWKEIGYTSHRSKSLWQRFHNACNTFFERRAAHLSEIDNKYDDNLQAKRQLIAEIEAFVPDGDSNEDFEMLNSFRQRWQEIGYIPIKLKEKIQTRYQEAIDHLYQTLKPGNAGRRTPRLKKERSETSSNHTPERFNRPRTEREKLYGKMMQLENEVALWENNIGFFAKSKKADKMIADVRHKIKKAKEEIASLEKQIRKLDMEEE